MFKVSRCRKCGTLKGKTDPCPGVACVRADQPMRTHKSMAISLTSAHGFHSAAIVPMSVARANIRF